MRHSSGWMLAGALIIAGACEDAAALDAAAVPGDQAAPLPGDSAALPIADLSDPGDLAARRSSWDLAWSMCVGTSLAGTCAEAFFEPFVACFHYDGACRGWSSNSFAGLCWENGASVLAGTLGDPHHATRFRQGATDCLVRYSYNSPTSLYTPTTLQFCLPGTSGCGPDVSDGGNYYLSETPSALGARYDTTTGVFTCPDGTQVNVGTNLGGCGVLNELLVLPGDGPPCSYEATTPTCPIN